MVNINPEYKVTLDLFGTIYDLNYWQKCMEIISRMPAYIKVNYLGPLEKAQIAKTLSNYHFFIMPSQGENYGHSIVESLLAGCPVIISDRTPWNDLNDAGWSLSLGKPEKFKEVIKKCIEMGEEGYNNMSRAALGMGLRIAGDKDVVQAYREMLKFSNYCSNHFTFI